MILKDTSCQFFRMIRPSSSPKKFSLHRKPSLPIKLDVPILKQTKHAAKNICDCVNDEDGNLSKWFGDEACKWLSSGINCCFESLTFSVFLDPSLDEWLYFLLSLVENPNPLVNKYIICFDGSRVNPIEEAYLVMKKALLESDTSNILQEHERKREEEEVISWLSSTGIDQTDSVVTCFSNENTYLFRDRNDLQYLISDSERKHYFLSLLNLEEEESCWWNSDTESEMESIWYGSDEFLSSNSCGFSVSKLGLDSTSKSNSSSDCVSEDLNLWEFKCNEPLVWPFGKKWDNSNPEDKADNSFVMSPCRQKNERGYLRVENDIERGNNFYKVIYAFGPESEYDQIKHINGVNESQRTLSTYSEELDFESQKISLQKVVVDTVDHMIGSRTENLLENYKILADEELSPSGKHPIEMFLGLEEFDGQEGIGKGLWNEYNFDFEELL